MKLPLRIEGEGMDMRIMDSDNRRLCEAQSTEHQAFTTDEEFMVVAVEALNSLFKHERMTEKGDWA